MGDPCPVGQLCDEANNTCGACVFDTDCDDTVACTVDTCVANGCVFTPVDTNCVDDGLFCTGTEICDPSLDCISTGDPCPVGQFCNDTTDVCDECVIDSDCDDLQFCTGVETCVGGTCVASGDPCLVGEFCNETLDTCDECVLDTDCTDNVGCTDDTCINGACVFTVNNLNCPDDTLFCNGTEFCDAALDCQNTGDPCAVGTFCNDTTDLCDECALDIDCDDVVPCTDDTCVLGSCVFTTNNFNCVDDGLFCTGVEICDATLDCISTGNPCLAGEFCNDVTDVCDTCQVNTDCNDSVPCTDDTCVAGNCVFATNNLNCVDDGLFCTGPEVCDPVLDCISTGNPCANPAFCSESTNVCLECLVGADCDDGVLCTDQTCVSGVCVFTANDANCAQDGLFCNGPEICDAVTDCFSSGDPCLVGEFCNETTDTCLECQIDSDCNDGLPCSDDLCINGTCVFPDNNLNCDDLVGCTDDTCVGGNCVFTTNDLNCTDDLLFCTGTEICDATLDCISTGDPCAVGTFCNETTNVCDECALDIHCDDLIGCTDDTCVAGSCVFTVNNLNCPDDLLFCNGTEFCDAALDCQSTGDPCPVGTFCNDTTDVCDECVVDTDCDDAVACTDDTCVAGSCVFTVNNLNCPDDTLFCNGTEFCDATLDCQSTGDPCPVGTFCNDTTDVCDECVVDTDCDDTVGCTDDTCVAGTCVFTVNNLNCPDDTLFCTGTEFCDATLDCQATGDPCVAGTFCNDTTDVCDECALDVHCDDTVGCTDDTCVAGSCVFTVNNLNCPDDTLFCNGTEFCSATLDCQSTGDPCPVGTFCNDTTDVCDECVVDTDCDDAVACTDDTCVAGSCVFTANDLNCADDTLFCTGTEFCSATLDCQSTGDPCPVGTFCNDTTDVCDQCALDVHCDDGVGCTDDTCVSGSCVFTANDLNCADDTLFCTGTEFCDATLDCQSTGDPCPVGQLCNEITDTCGDCLVDTDCDDTIACTDDTCVTGGCVFTPNNANCVDDLLFCTGNEICDPTLNCISTGDPCPVGTFCNDTTDVCDQCVVDLDCDDTLFCTGVETCVAGTCVASGNPCQAGQFCNDTTDVCDECQVDIDCNDGIGCTDDTCVAGTCVITANDLNCPDDALFCTGTEFCSATLDCQATGDPCAAGLFCIEATDACDECVVDLDCDDLIGCTDDTCVAGVCANTLNNANCVDDGLFCTGPEICDAVQDCISAGDPCLATQFCNDTIDTCLDCLINANCDDGVACTDGTCVGGFCQYTANDANCVQDGLFCNGPEICDLTLDCISSGDPCLAGEFCFESADVCLECLVNPDCDDGVACTDDTCISGSCVNTPNDSLCVSDGIFCNGVEFCDLTLDCQSPGDPCPVGQLCDELNNTCGECVIDADCNDGVACTVDTCVANGCLFTPVNTNCVDDGLFCTGTEICDPSLDCISTGDPCPVGQFCNDTTDVCDQCVVDTDCDDLQFCTGVETCVAGTCVASGDPCAVGEFCNELVDRCDQCVVDTDCTDNVGCTDDTCVNGSCVFTVNNLNCPDDSLFCNGTEFCDATLDCQSTGDPCAVGTFCNDTTDTCDECALDVHCDDLVPCTDDTCVSGSCVFTTNNLNCVDDGLFCTGSEICDATLDCISTGNPCLAGEFCNDVTDACEECQFNTDCTDGVLCTDDTCVGGVCTYTINNGNCVDDGLFCTGPEVCDPVLDCISAGNPCTNPAFCSESANACLECLVAADCDDGVGCTDESCNSGNCVIRTNDLNCPSDGLFCNGPEFCDLLLDCQSTGDPCLANEFCSETTDTCLQCQVDFDCDDGLPCSDNLCVNGMCIFPDNDANCNDGIGCTDDTCLAGNCVFTTNDLNCADDLLFCTGLEICDATLDCISTGDPCLVNEFCNDTTDTCDECQVNTDCNDTIGCTDDTCVAGSCVFTVNNLNCPDDTLFCNGTEFCSATLDCQSTGDPCPAGTFCNDTTDVCDECVVNTDCNDLIGCTDDTCVAGTCVFTANNLNCPDDTLFCNGTEFCDATLDCQSTGDPCPAGTFCADTTDTCDECALDIHCDDGVGCTDDTCVAGACVYTVNNLNCASDGLFCNGTEVCDATLDCLSTGDPCPVGTFCNDTTDTCDECQIAGHCNDGVPCTDNLCIAGTCVFTPNDAQCPSDGLFCTGPEICDSVLDCISAGNPCAVGQFCNDTTDTCDECQVNTDCNDGVACTDDTCVSGVCVFTTNNANCVDDGLFCTGLEVCDATLNCISTGNPCLANEFCNDTTNTCDECQVATDCNDNIGCTDDTCVAGTCVFTTNNANCVDDGLFCTGPEVCDAALDCISAGDPCLANQFCNDTTNTCDECQTNVHCDDGNPCTDDTCVSGTCQRVNNTILCDDNDLCTINDVCALGTCAGTAVDCSGLNDACNVGVCNAGTGACQPQPINNGGACPDDGNECTQDVCASGTCTHPNLSNGTLCTDDGNECTSDTCQSGTCTHPNLSNGTACTDDGIGCTTDFCQTGVCEHTLSDGRCNDNNECTDDVCNPTIGDPVTGCVLTPDDTNNCSDGNACTTDACQAGVCQSTAVPGCILCSVDATCDDGNQCTVDDCFLGACRNTSIPGLCNDGNACTEFDQCQSGTCIGQTVVGCTPCGIDIDCDDANSCTADLCVAGRCENNVLADGVTCVDDGITCTIDTCLAGACQHTPSNARCNDSQSCTDDVCDPSLGDAVTGCLFMSDDTNNCSDADPCTLDQCVAGACVSTVDPACIPCSIDSQCDDGNVCTFDECFFGACRNTPAPGLCNDGNPCSQFDQCFSGVCVGEAIPGCLTCLLDTECDDLNPCTNDTCVTGVCENTPSADQTPCPDEGAACTADVCISGVCEHIPDHNLCQAGFTCVPVDGCTNVPCFAPIVSTMGARYFAIDPQPQNSATPVKLFVTSAEWPCLGKYVGTPIPIDLDQNFPGGTIDGMLAPLVDNPINAAEFAPGEWGGKACNNISPACVDDTDCPVGVPCLPIMRCSESKSTCAIDIDCPIGETCERGKLYVSGLDITPSTFDAVTQQTTQVMTYSVSTHCQNGQQSPVATTTMNVMGDVDGNGIASASDISLIVNAFQGFYHLPSGDSKGTLKVTVDLGGSDICNITQPMTVNALDITLVVKSFQLLSYTQMAVDAGCALPCP